MNKWDSLAEEYVRDILSDYFCNRVSCNKSSSIVSDAADLKTAHSEEHIKNFISQCKVHDDDYLIFRIFDNSDTCIIDAGANWGVSVASFRTIGVKSRIFSFEANIINKPCLELVQSITNHHQFEIIGLSDSPGQLDFFVPLYNNIPITALCTAAHNPDPISMAKNIINHIRANWTPDGMFELGIYSFSTKVKSLDEFIGDSDTYLSKYPIVGYKIDVEGLEGRVLVGSTNMLIRHQPLIMVEGANRDPLVRTVMGELGYLFANRTGNVLELFDGIGGKANGFFLHKDRLSEYRDSGILIRP